MAKKVKLQPYHVISVPSIGPVAVPEETFESHAGIEGWAKAMREHEVDPFHDRTHFVSSDGALHSVPTQHIDQARAIDQGLQVVPSPLSGRE
jgi:hypothetical protein